jgi:hypothetical protein
MPYFDCDVDVTYRGVVTVEAPTLHEARLMAERGPGGWLEVHPHAAEYRYTEVIEVRRWKAGDEPTLVELTYDESSEGVI